MIAPAAPLRNPSGAEARLLAALVARGLAVADAGESAGTSPVTWLVSDGLAGDLDPVLAGVAARGAGHRILMLSRLRAHPDGPTPGLRRLWALEERARGTGLPVLTLRLGPMVGPASPLWRKLAGAPALPRSGRTLHHPVAEEDVVETLQRALQAPGEWGDWYDVGGPEVWSLGELAELAAGGDAGDGGAWEPPLEELERHLLIDPQPWLQRFGLAPGPLAERARTWGAAVRSPA